nr:MAG TPA: ASCH domain protein [Caudoviricetes sp.]
MNSGKPILFNDEMVRSILSGDKTCARRVVKPQPKSKLCYTFAGGGCGTWGYPSSSSHEIWGEEYRLHDDITKDDLGKRWIPPYHADDILYVRETWFKDVDRYMYRANYSDREKFYRDGKEIEMKWKPSIHMPKEAARIWLKVKDVRVERLQNIDIDGIRNEGLSSMAVHSGDTEIALKELAILWDSTIKKSDLDRYGWDVNPYVWVIEFERCAELGKE